MLLVGKVFADAFEVGDAHRLEELAYVGSYDAVVLQHTTANHVVHGDVLFVGSGPFAGVAFRHHLHQPLYDGRRHLYRCSFVQSEDVGHHLRHGDVVIPPVIGSRLVLVPRQQRPVDGTVEHLVAIQVGFGAGICREHAPHSVQVFLRLPIGTEEALIVYLRPLAVGRHQFHQAGGVLVQSLYRSTFVQSLADALQHQLIVIFRLHRFVGGFLPFIGVEVVDVGMVGELHLAGDGQCDRLFQVGEHFGGDADGFGFPSFGMVGDADNAFLAGLVGLVFPLGRGASATRYHLFDDERLAACIDKTEVVVSIAFLLVYPAEIVFGFGESHFLRADGRYEEEAGNGGNEVFFHKAEINLFVSTVYFTSSNLKFLK